MAGKAGRLAWGSVRKELTWTPSLLTGQVAVVCRDSGSAQVRATSVGVR